MDKNMVKRLDRLMKKYMNKTELDNIAEDELQEVLKKITEMKSKAEATIQRKKTEERTRQKQRELEEKKRREEEAAKAEAEHVRQIKEMELSLDWENFYSDDEEVISESGLSVGDAYIKCLNKYGRVDIEYISQVSGTDIKNVILTLKGAIYQNPATWEECIYKGWETREEYLSGNIGEKIRLAMKANERFDGYFDENIEVLKKVAPRWVDADDIYMTLGSPWIPADIYTLFINEVLDYPARTFRGKEYGTWKVNEKDVLKHDEITGSWEISWLYSYRGSYLYEKVYGTDKMDALRIVQNTLNMRSCVVYKEIKDNSIKSGKRRVIDEKETLLVLEKQKLLIKKFKEWIRENENIKNRLVEIYNEKFCCEQTRHYSGAYLELPGLNDEVTLFPYQKDAIARIIHANNTLLAHDVGAGKTYIMIVAGMELRRMGISKKNLYVVPNNIVTQWKNLFLHMYPQARLLIVEPKTFRPSKRNNILKKIQSEDYDGIIMAYSCFEMIDISTEQKMKQLEQQKEEYRLAIAKGCTALRILPKKVENIEKQLNELAGELIKELEETYEKIITFEELGIETLFLDEAHNYKNLPIDTKIDRVMGINKKGSEKCVNLLEKIRVVQKIDDNKSGRVVFATGTPLTNSIAEIYNIQRYLQNGSLGLLELNSFDAWVGMFAEKVQEFEIDVDTSNFRMATRFSHFHNIPELTNILAAIADFHVVENDIPLLEGYTDVVLPKTRWFQSFLDDISDRADKIRSRQVGKTIDNMLKLTTDGRKGALDLRLVGMKISGPDNKINKCSENVYKIWNKTYAGKSTQLVFCDMYEASSYSINVYDEIKNVLIGFGIPDMEIAFIQDATTEKQRAELFRKVNEGEIRVLIGSTMKLGTGVNVQKKLVAVHHLDVPWRPADMTQREGRILRQGNENELVKIYRYITEGSFDAYSWQLLETKQRFITDLLSGFSKERSADEIDNSVLDYGEVKALAVGNPLIKERVETLNELSKYKNLQAKMNKNREEALSTLAMLPNRIDALGKHIDDAREDYGYIKQNEEQELDVDTREKKEEEKLRKDFRHRFFSVLTKYTYETKEKIFEEYKGFSIHLPVGMSTDQYFVYLCRKGRYKIKMGTSDVGNVLRLDNFLSVENFEKYIAEKQEELSSLTKQKNELEEEIAGNENYYDEIEKYSKLLEEIDEALGVKKDE